MTAVSEDWTCFFFPQKYQYEHLGNLLVKPELKHLVIKFSWKPWYPYHNELTNWFPLPLNVSPPGSVWLAQCLLRKLYRSHPACLSANTFPTSPWWCKKNIMDLAQRPTRPLEAVWEGNWTEMVHKCSLIVTKWRLNRPARVGNLH